MNEHDSPDTGRDAANAPDAQGPDDVERTIPSQTSHDTDAGSNAAFDIDRTMPGKRTRMERGELAVGDVVLGRYELLEKLGSGAMGVVLKCRDQVSQVEFALKMVPPELARDADAMDDVRENFKLVQGLSHPNIAGVRFLERDEHGAYFLVMEYAEGENLAKWIKRKWSSGRPEPGEVADIVKQIASALDYAHNQGILHRDVKPANVMISETGRVKVLDFGLASKIRTSMSTLSVDAGSSGGTPGYLAPEQFKGRYPTPAADQYALGVLAYQMLAGHLPFESDDCDVLRSAVVNELPEMIRELPYDVNHCLQKALGKDPDLRYASCSEFASELERALEESTGVKKAFQSADPLSGQDGKTGYGGGKRGNIVWLVILLLACIGFVVYHFLKQGQNTAQTASSEQAKAGVEADANTDEQNGSSGIKPGVFRENESGISEGNEPGISEGNEPGPDDLNGNGIPDEWEKQFTLTETDPDSDEDGDRFSLKDEYLAKTIPTDPLSHPKYVSCIYVEKAAQERFPGLQLVSVNMNKANKKDWDITFSTQVLSNSNVIKKTPIVRIGNYFKNIDSRKKNVDFVVADVEIDEKTQQPFVYLRRIGKPDERIPCRKGQAVYAPQQKVHFKSALPLWSLSASVESGAEFRLGSEKTGEERYRFVSVDLKTKEAVVETLDGNSRTFTIPSTPDEASANALTAPGDRTIVLPGDVKLELVKVEAGSFEMSAKDGENGDNELPHRATLTNDFYIGRTEITQAQWRAVMFNNQSSFKGNDLPMEKVSWNDAMEFCEKLNSTGKAPNGWKFTLPTETQWEYAARGGKKSKGYKYSGSDSIDEVAWYQDNADKKTHPVALKKANELGLYDMSGNVWEWCLDDYQDRSDKLKAEFTRGNDQGGSFRVGRGGSWFSYARNRDCRSACRNYHMGPGYRGSDLGFRVALVPAEGYSTESEAAPANTTRQIPSSGQTFTASGGTEQRVQIPPGDKSIALPNGVKLELVKVEAGTFTMSARDGGNYPDEVTHRATLTKDFYIGQTEVTQAQWKAVMNNNPSNFKGDDLPVETVSWNDAMAFCEKLNSTGKAPSGWKFTLPTETQWEYAARGGKKSKGYKYSGSDKADEVAWYYENSGNSRLDDSSWDDVKLDSNHSKTHPVGQKKANELGLYDMSGNVYEWCLDDKQDRSDKLKAEFTRGNDSGGSYRGFRGGGWFSIIRDCRSGHMISNACFYRYRDLGFRVALVPESY